MRIVFVIFVFSQIHCFCNDAIDTVLANNNDTNETIEDLDWMFREACEVLNNCTAETISAMIAMSLSPQLCKCAFEQGENISQHLCYEVNEQAHFCHEAVSKETCGRFSNLPYDCNWVSGKCRADCNSFNAEPTPMQAMTRCLSEVGCFFDCTNCSCDGSCGTCSAKACSGYTSSTINAPSWTCNAQAGCIALGSQCASGTCTQLNDSEACLKSDQCDWHSADGPECGNGTTEVLCNEYKLCKYDLNTSLCQLEYKCRRKALSGSGGGGPGVKQCEGFGESECGERLVCKYDGVMGCLYKGDGSLVTKVGKITIAMVALLLLFLF